jgi:DNA-binding NarL/FixJ family response regulator
MRTEVVIVDDQELMRLSFRMVIDSQPDLKVTGEAADGREAVAVAAKLRPDVMLMDIRMPELDGVQATAEIMASDPDARILLVTTFDLDDYLGAGRRAGAAGFLLKDAAPGELLAAIRAVAAGQTVFPDPAPRSATVGR